ncbi:MAG: HIT domain-containing protein [Pseudomonadales bacterium]
MSRLLLMNNALLPWFILVPRVSVTEIYQLQAEEQQLLLQEINALSAFAETTFNADKLNIGAIGNIVSQLHIHVVARKKTDCCWPGVVWGVEQREEYTEEALVMLRDQVQLHFVQAGLRA